MSDKGLANVLIEKQWMQYGRQQQADIILVNYVNITDCSIHRVRAYGKKTPTKLVDMIQD